MLHASIQIEIHEPRTDDPSPGSPPSVPNRLPPHADTTSSLSPRHAEAAAGPRASASSAVPLPILDFVASNETLDRYGDVICPSGWHLETYRRNPVFQNAHQYGDILFTLGKALITEVRHIATDPGRAGVAAPKHSEGGPVLYQRIQFATDINPIARIAYGLYKSKFLNAVSVGFIPLRWQDADGAAHTSRGCDSPVPPRLVQNLSVTESGHFHRRYLEQELLEVSAVAIPANPEALALGYKAGAIEKADLRETLDLLLQIGATRPIDSSQRTSRLPRDLFQLARELHRILRGA